MKTWKSILFDDFESIHYQQEPNTNTNCNKEAAQYFCINPLNGPRRDANISRFANILLEFDQGELHEQYNTIVSSKIPYSLVTWSGNKSLHVIIALKQSLSPQEYKILTKRVYTEFSKVDKSCSNPSRLSRTPLAINKKTQQKQQIWEIGDRVDNKKLFDWLGIEKIKEVQKPAAKIEFSEGYRPLISIFTKHYLAFGSEPGKRNNDLFKAACDMFRCGWSVEEVFAAVAEKADLPLHEIKQTIKSAQNSTRGE